MNERIRELFEQSFITDDYVNVGINGVELGIRFDPEKFAKLIVKECIDIAYQEGDNVAYLALHFGVEE
jgi:hypothetical protein